MNFYKSKEIISNVFLIFFILYIFVQDELRIPFRFQFKIMFLLLKLILAKFFY